ncbi:hypothetical protein Nepgr_025199 [Nepenthes gracilis]|uniref:C2H2-type domain-containing protein n=1 Tax=Nepenthes gracilis TaxID=150966 RepID=A0AAD3Y192_NEPGR|nr:hypothetical protein Nepgr_025199 [Nepenthes gracilis]
MLPSNHNSNNNSSSSSVPSSTEPLTSTESANLNSTTTRRKRRPAGTPDPDAEVVSLSPRTLLESDRYVCEICNQGFQRDQNLQMHRRRHKVPWKLLKRENPVMKKRVYVCPEPSCLHHDPCHALGDLVGIKKHFRRKHSHHKQWVCDKCSKAYAVQSDYKAHLKTCGTRGHSCDCGRVFSRVESFIEHQDACSHMGRLRGDSPTREPPLLACLSRTASSAIPTVVTSLNPFPWSTSAVTASLAMPKPKPNNAAIGHRLELQLSIGSSDLSEKNESNRDEDKAARVDVEGEEQPLKVAMAQKAHAEEVRRAVKMQIEAAEREFSSAKKIRLQAQAELDKAQALKEEAIKKISFTLLQITCHACKRQCKDGRASSDDQNTS